jgi:hypothetical protein
MTDITNDVLYVIYDNYIQWLSSLDDISCT